MGGGWKEGGGWWKVEGGRREVDGGRWRVEVRKERRVKWGWYREGNGRCERVGGG